MELTQNIILGGIGRRGRLAAGGLALLMLMFLLSGQSAQAQQMQIAHFPAAAQSASGNKADGKAGFPIWGHLGLPRQAGPRPAIVLMHGCGGVQKSHLSWARMLNRQGYITLVVDSFRPRSIISACVAPRGSASYVARSYDAYGALAYLRGRADVDPEQIAVMGWSIGGAAAMNAVAQSGMAQKFEHRFKAAITFYPHCLRARSFDLPMLVMIGDRDEWTPADACRKLQSHLQDQGERPLDLVVYPGAYHAFDEEELKHGFKVPGADGKMHLLLYNKPAHDDSKSRVTDFLRQHLSPG